jgi:hypothetical protein
MAEDQEYDETEGDDDEGDGEGERFVRMSRADIRKLEKSGEKASKLEAEKAEMARELAFIRAGVDTETKLGKMFMKSYDGELEAEAIKAEAAEVGALKGDVAPKPVETDDGETESSDERSSLGAGANADQFRTGDPDPQEEAVKAGRAAMAKGGTEEDSLGVAFDVIAKAGVAGDKRAIWDPTA